MNTKQPGITHKQKGALSTETNDAVQSFYLRDDISRQAPGRKDVVTVHDGDGEKTKCQARHLTSSVAEVHALYREEFPQIKIGKSKFAELCPQHVLLRSKLTHNLCLCSYHENFITANNALHKIDPKVPLYMHDLPQTFLCDPPSRQCWFNECETCCDRKGFRARISIEESSQDCQLDRVEKQRCGQNMQKVVEEGVLSDICSILL